MTDLSPRFGLPLLVVGQAQKEESHNEAIIGLEALLQPVAETLGDTVPPASPTYGRSWIVGAVPTGDWTGQAAALATWTEGGWRFAAPIEGMSVYVRASGLIARFETGGWTAGLLRATGVAIGGQPVLGSRQPAIAAPAGGVTVDAEARAAISAILAAMRSHGLIST